MGVCEHCTYKKTGECKEIFLDFENGCDKCNPDYDSLMRMVTTVLWRNYNWVN